MVRRVVDRCIARGHDGEALCRSVGISLAALDEPDARLSYDLAARLGERAIAVSGDDAFGLRLARDVEGPAHVDSGLLLMMASPTVRVAFERMVAIQRYWGDGDRTTLRPVTGGLAVGYSLPGSLATSEAYARHANECALAEIALGVRALSGQPVNARVVRFRHRAPARTSEHEAVFSCSIEFDANSDEIVFDDAVLETPMAHANAAFSAIFAQHVATAMARLPAMQGMTDRVRGAVRVSLGASPTLGDTARVLGVSGRTLQRRLQLEGTSFAEVLDGVRRELARDHLARGLELADVASRLGYADTTAFHHAFRRWTGSSPGRVARD